MDRNATTKSVIQVMLRLLAVSLFLTAGHTTVSGKLPVSLLGIT